MSVRRRGLWRYVGSNEGSVHSHSFACCVSRRCLRGELQDSHEQRATESTKDAPPRGCGSQPAVGDDSKRRFQESWRAWLPMEKLQQIDVLTYLLGRYPRPETVTAGATSEVEKSRLHKEQSKERALASSSFSPALPLGGNVKTTSTLNAAKPFTSKRKKLAALNARALPAKSWENAAPLDHGCSAWPPTDVRATSRLGSQCGFPSSPDSATQTEKGPLTPEKVVEQLAQQWLRKEREVQDKRAKADAAEEAAWQALLQHPPHLFADDAAVYARFGMGGYVSPSLPGFAGLFRQRWQDFHVTEMVVVTGNGTTGGSSTNNIAAALPQSAAQGAICDAVPLSRNFDFSIPPLPSALLCCADNAAERERGSYTDDAPDRSFFAVDVKQRIRELQTEKTREEDLAAVAKVLLQERPHRQRVAESSSNGGNKHEDSVVGVPPETSAKSTGTGRLPRASASCGEGGFDSSGRYFLQCTLHKQHIAHGNALASIAQTLRIHPRSISVAGIKDYVGDTVQRVRLENVSPASALAANRRFRQKRLKMTLSDFSYEAAPLSPGDLFGNHFRVVLRDVDVPASRLADAIAAFAENGFPNYYGCQRFSWFAGRQDAAFALLRQNWLAFAFLFLNFTGKDRSLRELLQRSKKYPHPAQDEYRRGVVRRLRKISIEPADLDVAPFLSCPSLSAPLTHADGRPFSEVEELICAQLREAYFDLNVQSRRLTAQRLSSYLWNQVLTLRLHHIGGKKVLDGDLVAPASIRQLSTDADDRKDWYHTFGERVCSENRHLYTIEDVVHPGFSFDAITLPANVVGAYYEQICGKYALDWMAQHSRSGLRDFREPPRPIIRKPLNLSYEYNVGARVLTLKFALERGCYANVALSEVMKSVRCIGSEEVTVLPLPDPLWDALGEEDPGYVTTLQDIYEGYEDGVGFTNDEAPVQRAKEAEVNVWDHKGPFFRPASEDPFKKAHRWGSQHLLRNSERREKEADDMKRMLFDRPLAKQLKEGEVDTYAGHIVPLPPNASARQVYAKVMKRKRRYAGAPRMVTRMKRSTSHIHRHDGGGGAKQLPSFQSLNKNSWNFTW